MSCLDLYVAHHRLVPLLAGPLGHSNLQVLLPGGLLLDDQGGSVTEAKLAPSDLLTVLVAVAATTEPT